MMTLRCSTCDGYRKVADPVAKAMVTCPDCGGMGEVPDTTASDDLVEIMDEATSGFVQTPYAQEALAALDAHRPALTAWLLEVGYLQPTTRGLVPVQRDPTLAPYDKYYIAPGTTQVVDVVDIGDTGRALYMIVDQ